MKTERYVTFLGLQLNQTTWHNFRWDLFGAALFSLFNVVFNQFYVPISIRNGASDFQVGLLTAAPAIGLLFSPLWAGLVERGNPKPYVVIPQLIARSLILVPAFFTAPWVFVTVALVFQLLMGIQAPAYAAVITQIYPPSLRGRLMGNVRVVMGILMIPMAYLVGLWIDHRGSSEIIIAASVLGILSILCFQRVKELEPEAVSKAKAARKERMTFFKQLQLIKGNKALVLFLSATTLAGFGNLLANPLYFIIQVSMLNLSNLEIGYIRVAYFTCLFLAYLTMGWVIDRYSPKTALTFGFLGYVLVPLLYGFVGNYPAAIIAGGLQGFGDAIWDIGCLTYVFRIAKGKEAVVFGLHLMLFGIRGTIGPLLSTALMNSVSMQLILGVAALFALLGLLLLRSEKKEAQQDLEQEQEQEQEQGQGANPAAGQQPSSANPSLSEAKSG
ncbi:MFS transporter [Paenibacillus rigui]|uniref:MFS transporter n=1 Tax=Paenibacillus rigui TaxID=554312 RepID=A0A229UVA7_9BACL|nr:MFS transporter [Paenibacillus rigui]OXM87456.1 MFS transporter [Paenibacillus rigui]